MAELARVRFAGLTIEEVAKAAIVNRTTIYRRWPSKGALLLAVLEPGQLFDHDPDTGSLDGDLLALMLLMRETSALPEGRRSTGRSGRPQTNSRNSRNSRNSSIP
jgi:AcrR family transcriptional regulator